MTETINPTALTVATEHTQSDDGPTIIEEVADFIRRFVFFRDDVVYDLVAAWVVMTHLTDLFEYVGYLFAHSPEPQSGKSRLLDVLDLLVHNSSGILVSPTEAVLFRTAEGHTQLFDEVDSWRNREEFRSVLNTGFRFGGVVVRMREENSDFQPRTFCVFGPRALAGIGTRILDATTRDRTFMIEMVRQVRTERREQLRIRKIKPETVYLKKKIEEWAAVNRERIKRVYDKSDFLYLDDLRDRSIDILQPIATIIHVAYADSPQRYAAQERLLDAARITRDEQQVGEEHHKVVQQLLRLAESEDPLVGSATELSEKCTKLLEEQTSADAITQTLRRYGFKTKSVRKGDQPRQRYVLPKGKLAEILARYAPDQMAEQQQASAVGALQLARSEDDPAHVVAVVANMEEGGSTSEEEDKASDQPPSPCGATTPTTTTMDTGTA